MNENMSETGRPRVERGKDGTELVGLALASARGGRR
jgi:hypothetical protein